MNKNNVVSVSELRQKSLKELSSELLKNKKRAFELRFSLKSGELEKTDIILKTRRNTAKIKTVINEFSNKKSD